jgi:hypothetical protein
MRIYKECFFILVLIWTSSFWAGYAYGMEGQNCVYTTIIEYDNNGQILNSKQEYKCKSPAPVIVHHVGVGPATSKENVSFSSENIDNNDDNNNTSASGDVLGMALLWGLLSSGKKRR